MNANEIVSTILSTFEGAQMCRKSGSTFIAVPGDVVDGNQSYVSIKVGNLLAKDTKSNTAFDLDSAVAEYAEFEAKQTAKANAPKKSTAVDPAKQEAKKKRKDAIFLYLTENPGKHTCTEIKDNVPECAEVTIMTVGSDAKALFSEGLIDCVTEKQKNYYFAKE